MLNYHEFILKDKNGKEHYIFAETKREAEVMLKNINNSIKTIE